MLKNFFFRTFLFGILTIFFAEISQGAWFVSPKGNDEAPGTQEEPLRTIQAAINLAGHTANKDKTILVESGTYYLEKPLTIGKGQHGITVRAKRGADVVVCGGFPLDRWRRSGKFLVAECPKMDFRLLEVNGKMAERSRLPESGTFQHLSTFSSRWISSTEGGWDVKPTAEELFSMIYKPEDLNSIDDLENAEITLFHLWDETLVRVDRVNRISHRITFAMSPEHPAGAFGCKDYIVWNSKHGMRKPGDWYLDIEKENVYYYPREGERAYNLKAFVPVMNTLVDIRMGKDVRLEGIKFRMANTPTIVGGFGAYNFPGAIDVQHSRNVVLKDLEIFDVAGHGIKLTGKGCKIDRCRIHHTGGCGIRAYGTDLLIENNEIFQIGQIYPSSVALSATSSLPKKIKTALPEPDSRIQHNKIYDVPYSGIVGSGGSNVLIANNRIFDSMKLLSEGAAIYLSGARYYTIRENFVSDIKNEKGAIAFYLDENCMNNMVQKNLSLDISCPIRNHMAEENSFCDNIFIIEKGEGKIAFPRSRSISCERNIFVGDGSITIEGKNYLTAFANNLFFIKNGDLIAQNLKKYIKLDERKLSQRDSGVLMLDPQFDSDYKKGIIFFRDEGRLKKYGIQSMNVSGAGPTKKPYEPK
ncbi:MAG: right-handed parallel beta-helix repeat-containing protein [Planctomycetia bacterium]|nr:right-handed parallel beta-helix repeat-containing protein [Planctomycetia bacterium]